MTQQTIDKAVRVINRAIRRYQRILTFQLEVRAEAKHHNGNLKVAEFGDYESHIKKYETVLADLATIKRAIKKEKGEMCHVKIQGIADGWGTMYNESFETIRKAGFLVDSDWSTLGTICLIPMKKTYSSIAEG